MSTERSVDDPRPGVWRGQVGTDEEERIRGTIPSRQVLVRLHEELRPLHYLEIGIRRGASLALARCPAIGVDPWPTVDRELPVTTRTFEMTSDEFFRAPDLCPPLDVSFIDGLHLFEYVLRDFMNVERCAARGAIVVLDDIFPNHPAQADRKRRTRHWTGDVWRLLATLRVHRPDLFLVPLDSSPTGLLLVAGLDPANSSLRNRYDELVAEAVPAAPPPDILQRRNALDPTGARWTRILETLKRVRAEGRGPAETVATLRLVCGAAE